MKKTLFNLVKVALSYKGWMILAAITGFLTIGSGIGLMMTSAYIIAKSALHPSIAELQIGIVGVRFFGISRGIFRYLERYISHEVTFKLLAKFRVWFYQAIEPLAPAKIVQYKSGDLLNRLVSDVESLEHIYSRVLAPPLIALLISALMFVLLGIYDILFSFILLLSFFVSGFIVPLLIYYLHRQTGAKIIQLRSQLQMLSVDSIQGLPELLIFGQVKKQIQNYEKINGKLIQQQRNSNLINSFHEALLGLLMNLTIVFLFLVAIPKVTDTSLNGVYLSIVVLGVMAAFEANNPLPFAAQYLNQSVQAGERILEIIERKPAVIDLAKDLARPIDYSIRFENVCFKYAPNCDYALWNINFSLEEGKKLAIVGPSGAGKSTVINLLLKLWETQEGNIYLGGENIRNFSQEALRNYFGVVAQRSYLFHETILTNLKLGNSTATPLELNKAIEQVQLQEFFQNSHRNYNSWIGEQGGQISGGEKQRIAIARALVKKAPIYLFDEPTANLDAMTGQQILKNLWQDLKNKTVLFITHRLPGLENMDDIIVLNNGRIIERGTHSKLISAYGVYQKMWQIQNQVHIIETMEQIR